MSIWFLNVSRMRQAPIPRLKVPNHNKSKYELETKRDGSRSQYIKTVTSDKSLNYLVAAGLAKFRLPAWPSKNQL